MKLLFIGDIVARPGRDIVRRGLAAIVRTYAVDMVIANGENAAGGAGLTRDITNDLFKAGIDVLTSGNHIWDKREVLEFIDKTPRLLRPANYPASTPGSGSYVWTSQHGIGVGVINAMGRIFMAPLDDPFVAVANHIAHTRAAGARVLLVDFHAEATSEKLAMGWHFDGQVTAVVGTHTHVQTADERILPNGTAYVTDVGMTGPHDGIIGMDRAGVIARFVTGLPSRFEAAAGDSRLHAVLITADADTGRATGIERLSLTSSDVDAMVEEDATEAASNLS
ncbi:MAG: TIGR00282 family metallophosphoesterase [Acidobacteria bacterium]|nr:TIGR00282 family metallophosphoesterase [Acidobacteriota bacterium]